MKFNSQICTTRKQSERLLALGIKKETADMWYYKDSYGWRCSPFEEISDEKAYLEYGTPAWSLHRLIEMGFNSLALLEDADDEDEIFFKAYKNPFESMLEMFEYLIKEGYFDKEYLEKNYDSK